MVVCTHELESTEESGTDVPRGRGGSYTVFVRVRPPLGAEVGKEQAVEVVSRVKLRVARYDQTPLFLRFDRTFEPQCGQADVFDSVRELIAAAADGRSGTIIAYGQTGSGKTHTMIGEIFADPRQKSQIGAQKGIIARGLEYLFQWTRSQPQKQKSTRWQLYVSFMEIYNERVYDLLSENHPATSGREIGARGDTGFARKPQDAADSRLDVRENPDGSVCVPGVTVVEVHSGDEAIEVLKIGILNRKCGDNGVNRASSRSHVIFQVLLEKHGSNRTEPAAKINFVDLAGSEKLQPDANVNSALKQELTSINHSLSSLGNCISALVDQKRTHVPYRNSRLTRLLQDSLRGHSLTAMCICISPAFSVLEETLSSLKFADRAKRAILDRQQTPQISRGAEKPVAELVTQVQELQDMLKSERAQRLKLESILQERRSRRAESSRTSAEATPRRQQKVREDSHAHPAAARQQRTPGLEDCNDEVVVERPPIPSHVSKEAVMESSTGYLSRPSPRGTEEHAHGDELAASSVSTAAGFTSVPNSNAPAVVAEASPAEADSGIAQQLLAIASDVEHEEADKEDRYYKEAERERRSTGSIDPDDAPLAEVSDDKKAAKVQASPDLEMQQRAVNMAECTSPPREPLCDRGVIGSDAQGSRKAAKSSNAPVDVCITDISAQLSALANQNSEVLARLEALESRSGQSDDASLVGGRWRRAAVRRLQEASSDPSLSASDLRHLICEAFPPAATSAGQDLHSESSTEQSDHAPPSQSSTREDRIAGMQALHSRMRGRSPTIHEASPWAPVTALNAQSLPEHAVHELAASQPAAALSPSASGSCSSQGGLPDSPMDLAPTAPHGIDDGSPGDRNSLSTNASLSELRRRHSPLARSPSRGDAGPSPPWGKACLARDSSEETERALRIAHTAVSQTSQLAHMRLKVLEKRAEEASQQGEQLARMPQPRGLPVTPRLEELGDSKFAARPKATGKPNTTPPARPDRGASGSSSPAPASQHGDGHSQVATNVGHGCADDRRTKPGERSSCRPSPEKAHAHTSNTTAASGDLHSASALGRGAPLSGVAATVKEQLRRQKELLRRGRDDRARLRNERQRSSGSPSPSVSPNHELWSCLGRPSSGQVASDVGSGRVSAGGKASSNQASTGAGSNHTRVSEVVSRCWEEFEGALQRAAVPAP